MKGTCSVICPLFKAEGYLKKLTDSILMQKNVKICEVIYVLTDTGGDEEKMLKEIMQKNELVKYEKIRPEEFSHSLTRERAMEAAQGEIIVFLTQDVEIRDDEWMAKLTAPIIKGEAEASYARQKTKYDNIEKYTREYNYPARSFVVSKEDVEKRGLKTFFFSDAAGAILKKTFVELGGYDGKKLPIAEDMYFAYKLIMNGGRIAYVADAVVYHSHKFSLKELYDRYKLTGKFFGTNRYLDKYGTNGSGANMAKYVLKRLVAERRLLLMMRYPFDMGARYIGMKVGKK